MMAATAVTAVTAAAVEAQVTREALVAGVAAMDESKSSIQRAHHHRWRSMLRAHRAVQRHPDRSTHNIYFP